VRLAVERIPEPLSTLLARRPRHPRKASQQRYAAAQILFVFDLLLGVVDAHRQFPQPLVVDVLDVAVAIHDPRQCQFSLRPVCHRIAQAVQVLPNRLAVVAGEWTHQHRCAIVLVLLGVSV
jgi:hypothetical protein